MRTVLAYLLLVFYLILSLGVSVHFHYCKGNLKNISLFSAEACCPEEAEGSCSFHSSCCNNEVLQIGIPADYTNPQLQFIKLSSSATIHTINHFVPEFLSFDSNVAENSDCRGAPPEPSVPGYIRFCSLTYYG